MSFRVGQSVLVQGLRSAPQYNGERALVNDFLGGKVEIKLGGGKTILVKPEKLQLLEEQEIRPRSSRSSSRTSSPEKFEEHLGRGQSPHRRRSDVSYREFRKSQRWGCV